MGHWSQCGIRLGATPAVQVGGVAGAGVIAVQMEEKGQIQGYP